jgi:hypothetical protein
MKSISHASIAAFCLALATVIAPVAVSAQTSTVEKPVLGNATIEPDGTITLHMFRTGDGRSAHANLVYGVNNAQYKYILDHIGPIKPGESKPVLPFDDPASEKK